MGKHCASRTPNGFIQLRWKSEQIGDMAILDAFSRIFAEVSNRAACVLVRRIASRCVKFRATQ
jgi:hypothetical protein